MKYNDVFHKFVYWLGDSEQDKITGPVFESIPRAVNINDVTYTVFTANYVTLARTALVVPIAIALKYEYFLLAALCVVIHDLLDHVDGIVARIHKRIYGQIDDPLLGGFLDAICDKIVILTSLWSILMVTRFELMSPIESITLLSLITCLMLYEIAIAVIRIQDYFLATFLRDYKRSLNRRTVSPDLTSAVMVGKLKEKLESMSIACLCLSQMNSSPVHSVAGISAIVCLVLSVYFAHRSLQHKITVRRTIKQQQQRNSSYKPNIQINSIMTRVNHHVTDDETAADIRKRKLVPNESTNGKINEQLQNIEQQNKRVLNRTSSSGSDEDDYNSSGQVVPRRYSSPIINTLNPKVDKVYTIGCFDLFHHGHVTLLQRMKSLGRQTVIGVHDSRSYYRLKKKYPIDSTQKRMLKVNEYADVVFAICSTDPSNFMTCIIHLEPNETALYVRGDDMPNFPARGVVESHMNVHFLPYTQGVSSTAIRKEKYSHVRPDDDSNLSDTPC
ncbi:uncharacterized protein LOC141909887 isoform X2 [Tubulanus polymorphus]|uniref:uncharacterized protein LOC141909887 isoform X2 n=1 Tax=Tubulanus polymorphus TaxID=672921 RepID=UPI003DA41241